MLVPQQTRLRTGRDKGIVNIMAIFSGIFSKQSGSIGSMTLRRVNGVTITSEKVTRNTSKTFAQLRRWVQMANITGMWRAFEGNLRLSFEGRRQLMSDMNRFVQANLGRIPVYLTSQEATQGGAVVAPYQITRGSLPSVEVVANGPNGEVGTDISLGSLTIGESTTLKQFSDAVVNNNANYQNGDQISCFVAKQSTNSVTGVPYVEIDAYEVTLDQTDNETLLSEFDPDGVVFTTMASSDKLGMSQTVNGGVAYVHSRKTPSGTKVSTQELLVNNTLLPNYQSDAKMLEAVKSYGGTTTDAFLTPNVDLAPERG